MYFVLNFRGKAHVFSKTQGAKKLEFGYEPWIINLNLIYFVATLDMRICPIFTNTTLWRTQVKVKTLLNWHFD